MILNWDPWQIKFLATKGDKILCTGRQVGKSEVCGADAGEFAVNNPDTKPIVMIAPTERQARGLFTKTLNYLAAVYPHKLIKTGKYRPTNQRICLKKPGSKSNKRGVEIFCLPVGKDGLGIRFLTIGRLYKDECSRIPELVHEAVDPALLTTGGDEILLSTPHGAIGTFYEVWINKGGVFNSFTRISVTSEKVMKEREICETWTLKQREKALMKLDQAKMRWTKRRYAQEYLGKFDEALHRWFSDKLITQTCILQRRESFIPSENYYLGVDVARMGEDEGTFEILQKISKDEIIQIENIVTTKKLTTETEDKIIQLHQIYNFKKIWIDAGSGSLGVSVLDHLLREDSTKRQVEAIDNKTRMIDRDGKKKSKLKKEDLYSNLLALMEQGKIKLLDDDEIFMSLQSVQYEYVMKEGEQTKLKIYGDYTHIVEGLIRAAECSKEKDLKLFVDYF